MVVLRLRSRRNARCVIYTLIGTAKLNDIDPQAWLADVLARIASHPVQRLRATAVELAPAKTSPQPQRRLNRRPQAICEATRPAILAGWVRRTSAEGFLLELLVQEAGDQPIGGLAEIGACRQDPAIDASLGLAVEERAAIELPPDDAVPHEADGSADVVVRRIRPKLFQQREGADGGHPAFVVGGAPLAAGRLAGEDLSAPTLRGDARPLGRDEPPSGSNGPFGSPCLPRRR